MMGNGAPAGYASRPAPVMADTSGPDLVVPAHMPAARKAEALLAATGAGSRSLLLGRSGADVSTTICALGGDVVVVSTGAWLAPASQARVAGDPARVHAYSCARLPFADASFDSIFAPYLGGPDAAVESGTKPGTAFLEECARLLKPGGRLVITLPNPWLLAVLRSAVALLRVPVFPSGAVQRVQRHQAPRSPLPYSKRRLATLLRNAGLAVVADLEVWPRLGSWDILIPETGGRSRRRLLRAACQYPGLSRALTLIGVAPGRCIIAETQTGARGAAARPVLDEILTGPDGSGSVPHLIARGRTIALTSVGKAFFKIALSPEAAERQRAEIAAHRRLRDSPAARFMVDCIREGRLGRLSFAEYPLAEPIKAEREADYVAAQAEAFSLLAVGAEMQHAGSTPSWRRIFSGPSRMALASLGAEDLCVHLERSARDKRVLCGMVHGDLNLHNLMLLSGRTVLIDWDRFEPGSPLIIDRCNGVFKLVARRLIPQLGEDSDVAALRLVADRDPTVPLLTYIDEGAGDLAWWEVITLHVLSSSSWRMIHHGATAAAERDIRRHLSLCRVLRMQ
jgi:SAM-dependent methyltransferase